MTRIRRSTARAEGLVGGPLSALLIVAFAGCDQEALQPPNIGSEIPSGLAVSEPAAGLGAGGAAGAAAAGMVWVSAEPGTFPGGASATVTNTSTGATATAEVHDGGFDPVGVAGVPGDELEIVVRSSDGTSYSYRAPVPERKRPRVVRTRPGRNAVDVRLNATIVVVFSEPVEVGTVTVESVGLRLDGVPVEATLALDEQGIEADLTPASPLEPGTTYTLLVTTDVQDLSGDALDQDVRIDFATVSADTPVFTQVSAGGHHTCGITSGHVLYCWGFNFYGQLGNGSTRKTPLATPVYGALRFTQVSTANGRTCGVATDGRAYCWGYNRDGQLGDGTLNDRFIPAAVAGNIGFAHVSAGHELVDGPVSGVATEGVAYCWPACWGRVTHQPAPSPSGLTFTQVSSGAEHTCGVTADHAAYCWGLNFHGEFGDGTIATEGPTPESRVAGDLPFVRVSAGSWYTCGLTTDNLAYCWGLNGGSLGDGTVETRLTPTRVAGDLRFVQLTTGQRHACGVTTDQVAYCWGSNTKGQLGDGTTADRLAPTPVAGGLGFERVSAGDDHTCGITIDDAVYCWGFNHSGQLGSRSGYDSNGFRPIPTPIDPVF